MNSDRGRRARVGPPGLLLLAFMGLSGCGGVEDGLTKFPVRGTVLVDGRPVEGVRVRCYRDGLPGDTNADTPVGVTDDEGRFELSTNGEGDGAVAGTYKVTFFWPDFNGPGGRDQLDGRAGSPGTTPFEGAVVEGENDWPTFELMSATGKTSARSRRDPDDRPR